jgi:glycosyltransferase involved in cell wall biosynthesis
MRHVRLLWATFDGVDTVTSGVGTLTRYLLDEWPAVCEQARSRIDVELALELVSVAVVGDLQSPPPRPQPGVTLTRVGQGLGLHEPFGNLATWQAVSEELADHALRLARDSEVLLVINDTPFLGAATLLADAPILVACAPHSTARIWSPNELSAARESWERAALAGTRSSAAVLAISEFMKRHLLTDFGVSPDRIVRWNPGVSPTGMRRLSRSHPWAWHWREQIGGSGKFLMWLGRDSEDKGAELAASAFLASRASRHHELLVFLADYGSVPSADQLSARFGPRVRTFRRHPFELPRVLMGHPDLAGCLVTSRVEPYGLVSHELRVRAAICGVPALPVIAVDEGGPLEYINDGIDGLTAERATGSLAGALDRLGSLGSSERARMCETGRQVTANHHDLTTNLVRLVGELLGRRREC